MATKAWVDDIHYRVTSDDGKTSHLYEVRGLLGRAVLIGIVQTDDDGSTTVYEPGDDYDAIFNGGRCRPSPQSARRLLRRT